jgi:hypothetical protein
MPTDRSDAVNLATAAEFHGEIARLAALVESLRREVREQRREIAGLREERRAILDADRPQPDRPEAIQTDSTPGTVESGGDSGSSAGKSDQTAIPPAWLSRPYYVDPPSGWMYGFPRLYDPQADGDMTAWLIAKGYPERLARQGLPCTFTACTETGGK